MKTLLSLFCFVLLGSMAFSQKDLKGITVSGRVVNERQQLLADVSVTWKRISGKSQAVLAFSTDSAGQYTLDNIGEGYYQLQASFTGYETFILDSVHMLPSSQTLVLPDIQLQLSVSNTLEDAVVIHRKAPIESRDGTITLNVDALPSGASSTGAELLRNLPMVGTDPEGKVLVKGKPPVILIDEKPVEMNGQQLSDLLESLPGSAIEKIELMQNPPPEYAGSEGGVINIVTKKGSLGWMGRFTVTAGTIGQKSLSLNLNYRDKKKTFSVVLGTNQQQLQGYNQSRRENLFADSSNLFLSDGGFENKYLRPNFRIQGSYDITSKKQLSFSLQGNASLYNQDGLTGYTNINAQDEVWRLSYRNNTTEGANFSIQPQISFTRFGKTKAEKLQLIAAFTPGQSENDRLFFQEFLNPDTQIAFADSTQLQSNRNESGNGSFRLNYQKPLGSDKLTFTTGAIYALSMQQNMLQTMSLNKTTGEQEINDRLSTDNRFRQQVLSLRAGINYKFAESWRLALNLQWEGTHFDFKFKTALPNAANDYMNWLPSFNLRKTINKKANASLVYRKTIRRPGAGELNPAIDYSDPYNLRSGNPALEPATAHQFDLNMSWNTNKRFINGSVGFNRVSNIINRIRTLQPDGGTYALYQNVANRNEYEVGVWSGYSFNDAWRLNTSAVFSYNQYGEREKKLYRYRDGSTINLNLNTHYTATPLMGFDGSVRYNAFADPQGRSRSNWSLQVGGQYKFFERRLIVGMTAIDPINRQEIQTITTANNFRLENYRASFTRNYRLSVGWAIQPSKKAKTGSSKRG